MSLSKLALVVSLAVAALAGCSGGDGEIALEPATSPLTSEGGDQLFVIRIVEAREGGYALSGLAVKAIVDGMDPLTVSCSPTDANGNGALDTGDTLTCSETADDQFDASLAGQEIEVELYAQVDGAETKVGSATWKPSK